MCRGVIYLDKRCDLASMPNIIYILADDMGYGDLNCFNECSKIKTTYLDQLASEGMRFTDAHSSSAVCTPSRYSILTGRYNWRSRLKKGVLGGYSPALIEPGRLTLASMLKERGYSTFCIGKWHLGMNWTRLFEAEEKVGFGAIDGIDYNAPIEMGPVDFGFDYFYGISASLDMPPYVYIENNRCTQIPAHDTEGCEGKAFWRKGPTAPDFKHREVLPHLTEKVLGILNDGIEQPFFLYFSLPAPHTPILPTEEYIGKTGTNDYGDFVLMCDDMIGRVLKCLKENGLYENTLVVFTSDNGCSPMADYDELLRFGHNPSYIFRGYKADIYEGGHRVPLIVRWPGKIKPGSICKELVCLVDFMATIAEIVGYDLPYNAAEDSISNLQLWLGSELSKPFRDSIVHHSFDGSFSIRKNSWKLELCPGSGGWSYPKPGEEPDDYPPVQLYDLSMDISERKNLYDKYPDIAKELFSLLLQYVRNGRSTPGIPVMNNDEILLKDFINIFNY